MAISERLFEEAKPILKDVGLAAEHISTRSRGTFLFDIDNTITLGEHAELWPMNTHKRMRYLSNPGESALHLGYDWDEWNKARAQAVPNMGVIGSLKRIQGLGYDLHGMTARTREADPITRRWLNQHGLNVPFISRPMEMGMERSALSKGKLLTELQSQGRNVIGGIEDSASNVEMFNARGVPHARIENGRAVDIPSELPHDIQHILRTPISSARLSRMKWQMDGMV